MTVKNWFEGQINTQAFLAFLFGIIFIILMLILAIAIHTPSNFQYFVFRVALSLAAAGIAAMIPGFITMDFNIGSRIAISAVGAFVIFIIVYALEPAQIVVENPPPSPNETALEIQNAYTLGQDIILMGSNADIDPNQAAQEIQRIIDYFGLDFQYEDLSEEEMRTIHVEVYSEILNQLHVKRGVRSHTTAAYVLPMSLLSRISAINEQTNLQWDIVYEALDILGLPNYFTTDIQGIESEYTKLLHTETTTRSEYRSLADELAEITNDISGYIEHLT